MRSFFRSPSRRSRLAGVLAVVLFSSPAAALRMLNTLRFTPTVAEDGPVVGAKLRLQRKTPPLPIETHRPLVIRKSDAARPLVPFDRGLRDACGRVDHEPLAALPTAAGLKTPAYLSMFLPSTPQNPVFPPDPDPLS